MLVRAFAVSIALSACWPGRCEGGLRALLPLEATLGRDSARLSINLDTNLATGPEVLAASGLSPQSVLLEGPSGPIPLSVEASINSSAHSCASRGTLRATSSTPLAPGDYTFIVLLDQVKWPAINDDDVSQWQGHRAMVRHYRVP